MVVRPAAGPNAYPRPPIAQPAPSVIEPFSHLNLHVEGKNDKKVPSVPWRASVNGDRPHPRFRRRHPARLAETISEP